MPVRSADVVRDAALQLRALEITARAKGQNRLARASGILAGRYEALAVQLSANDPASDAAPPSPAP